MKKKLEEELISIAHKILQLKNKSDVHVLQEQSRILYEKLTVLSFAETHFEGVQPTIGKVREQLEHFVDNEKIQKDKSTTQTTDSNVQNVPKKIESDTIEKKSEKNEVVKAEEFTRQVATKELKKEDKIIEEISPKLEERPELIIEEINARVTGDLFVRANEEDRYKEALMTDQSYKKNDFEEITAAHEGLPILDKIKEHPTNEKPKSLHDRLKKGIHIGLNDRLAFIKHLFDGSSADYNRVLSQLNTYSSKEEADDFIQTMVKPDHNHWNGKEVHEERFINLVMSKFE
ncbi:hypothetical protein ACE939_13745 [Aquimarina sp. W85]|uniref:hypothetical protein n=1 Tax=Aquimarina rhodophyticola TaxID=3342246 RepID=UPI0036728D85